MYTAHTWYTESSVSCDNIRTHMIKPSMLLKDILKINYTLTQDKNLIYFARILIVTIA